MISCSVINSFISFSFSLAKTKIKILLIFILISLSLNTNNLYEKDIFFYSNCYSNCSL